MVARGHRVRYVLQRRSTPGRAINADHMQMGKGLLPLPIRLSSRQVEAVAVCNTRRQCTGHNAFRPSTAEWGLIEMRNRQLALSAATLACARLSAVSHLARQLATKLIYWWSTVMSVARVSNGQHLPEHVQYVTREGKEARL